MRARDLPDSFPCSLEQAENILWFVHVLGWSQAKAGFAVRVHSGTVNHVVHGRRYPQARPKPPPGFLAA